MSRAERVFRSAVGVLATAGLGAAGLVAHGAAAATEWSPPQQLRAGDLRASGVLDNGVSVSLDIRPAEWVDDSGSRHTGTALQEFRRPVAAFGGRWSAPLRVRRWPAVECRFVGGAEGGTVAAAVWCRDDDPGPGLRHRLSRTLVWDGRWRRRLVANTALRIDHAPAGNVVFSGTVGRTVRLLTFSPDTGWDAVRRREPAGTRATRAAIDDDGDLLLAHRVRRGSARPRLVVQRRLGGVWRRPRVLDRPARRLSLQAVDVNGRGDAVVAWTTRTAGRAGSASDVLKAAVGTRRGWRVDRLVRRPGDLLYARAAISGRRVVTVAWQRGQGRGTPTGPAVISLTRSAAGVWSRPQRLDAGAVSLRSLDVSRGGRAVVTYSRFVRLRPPGRTAWGPEHALGTRSARARRAARPRQWARTAPRPRGGARATRPGPVCSPARWTSRARRLQAPRSGSASPATAPRPGAPRPSRSPATRPSAATVVSWPSRPRRPTWSRVTPTTWPTCSCTTGRPASPNG